MSLEAHVRVSSCKLSEEITLIRVDDRYNRFFEGVWSIPEGITYNSYLVFGEDKVALLDTTRYGFADPFLEELRRHVEPRDIDYLVVHHAEPDHTGALPQLLALAPRARVVGSPLARRIIEKTYGVSLSGRFTPTRSGYRLELGGVSLVFEATPWLHWPETIMSLMEPGATLFSGDAWGSYGIPEGFTDREAGLSRDYLRLMRKYFATVIGHYRRHVAAALEKLSSSNWLQGLKRIAPLHGLVFEDNVARVVDLYGRWSRGEPEEGNVVVIAASSYGIAGQALRETLAYLEEKGYSPEIYGFDSLDHSSYGDILGSLYDAEAIIVIASTYEDETPPTMQCLASLVCSKAANRQPTVIVGSYGWSGGGAKRLAEKLADCLDVRGVYEYPGGELDTGKLYELLDRLGLSGKKQARREEG